MSWFLRWFGIGGDDPPAPRRRSSGVGGSSHALLSHPSGQAIGKSSSKEIHPIAKSSSKEQVPPADGAKPDGKEAGDKAISEAELSQHSVQPERESWGSKCGFLLTLVGYAVGFGNIWRFPYLMHGNGGLAFLIPYCIMLAFCGIPIFFLELAVGQRLRKGALGSWNEISPYLGGMGLSCGLVCFLVELYYNTLVAWVIMYFVDSFRADLAWRDCNHIKSWAEPKTNITVGKKHVKAPTECLISQPTKYYWFRRMLDISPSITEPGNFNPWVFLFVSVGWILVLVILIKGIKSSEKVVYVTATFPYVVLFAFFVANFFVDGWREGYEILLTPDFSKLLVPQTWLKAGSQIFFSLGVGYGCLIVFASYLPSNNNCHRDAVSVSLINCGTSLFAAVVLFPVFGSIGKKKYKECLPKRIAQAVIALGLGNDTDIYDQDKINFFNKTYVVFPKEVGNISSIWRRGDANINKSAINFGPDKPWEANFTLTGKIDGCNLENFVRNSGAGTGLVFIGFAEAVSKMPFPPIWSILFFFMLFTLGIDSSFGTLEGAIAAVVDMRIIKLPRWAITSIMVGILWVLSTIFSFGWGYYVLNFIDTFVANWSLLLIGFMETIGIVWVYGLAKFSYDIKLMTGSRPNIFILVCWKFITPLLILGILITTIVFEIKDGVKYDAYDKNTGTAADRPQVPWIVALGYLLLVFVIMWVPLQAICVRFGKSILKKETPAHFPEDELRAERNMGENDEEEFGRIDQLVMGRSIGEFQSSRSSKTSIPEAAAAEAQKSPRQSVTKTSTDTDVKS